MATTREEMLAAIDAALDGAANDWVAAKAANPENPYGTDESARAYESSARAMVDVGKAAFNYAASEVGASGFQGSWAALTLYGELVGINGPFIVLKAEDMLYPQYDLIDRLREFIESDEMARWLGEQAAERLQGSLHASESVREHWQKLVERAAELTKEA